MFKKIALILYLFLFVFKCTDNVSGGADDINNGFISGIASNIDSTSTSGSTIKLIPLNYDPISEQIPIKYIDTISSSGFYKIGPVDSGIYNLITFSYNKNYSSIIQEIKIEDSDTTINCHLDSSIHITISIPSNNFDSLNYLHFTGTDIFSNLSNNSDTISFTIPKKINTSLIIRDFSFTPIDTLLNEEINSDTAISIIDTADFIRSIYYSWNSLGITPGKPIDFIIDSSENIWTIFPDRIVGILMTDMDSINIVNYEKGIINPIINKITCAIITPWQDILIGTNGQGLITGRVSSDGTISAFTQYISQDLTLLSSDTISSIGFKGDSLMFAICSDTLKYGNYLSNNLLLSVYSGPNSQKGFFFYDSLVVHTSNGQFKELNLKSGSYADAVINFTQGSAVITSFNLSHEEYLYLGLQYSGYNEGVFFDGANSLIYRYTITSSDTNATVKSATHDLNSNDWFGFSNGELVYVIGQNDANSKIVNKSNSNLKSDLGEINELIINSQNYLFASNDTSGFTVLDLNTLP